MQVILYDLLLDDYGELEDSEALFDPSFVVPVGSTPVSKHLKWAKSLPWDYRGPKHVENFHRAYKKGGRGVPPVVLNKSGKMVDGRHRILGAAKAGVKKVPAIDLKSLAAAVISWEKKRNAQNKERTMDREKVAEELLKLAKELTAAEKVTTARVEALMKKLADAMDDMNKLLRDADSEDMRGIEIPSYKDGKRKIAEVWDALNRMKIDLKKAKR
jgi:hypothetical protein